MLETPSVTQLSQVISHAIAPAFILGAVAGFISVLVTRLNRIIDRCRVVGFHEGAEPTKERVYPDMSQLNRRAALINRALFWAVASALVTILLMIVAFVDAFFELPHERGVALLFTLALILFGVSLISFAREIRIAIMDPNNYD
ncbi:DUF2721 domain-containing protein [Bradyrhizobium erythrophlei]|jgi:hypothetical protein|uniref:DUF2721 domain-containing protein n=1 Tax=Bradyrhizobium erythrophlei TaxID=1437360 RepID=A0A1H5DVL9_9BRAD|nr:DUF2721 domain-containing protein [Bradyrhizobium erythrophlei]SED82816.1 Protein of unknown function [Bradyrhizobium erythrophlei]